MSEQTTHSSGHHTGLVVRSAPTCCSFGTMSFLSFSCMPRNALLQLQYGRLQHDQLTFGSQHNKFAMRISYSLLKCYGWSTYGFCMRNDIPAYCMYIIASRGYILHVPLVLTAGCLHASKLLTRFRACSAQWSHLIFRPSYTMLIVNICIHVCLDAHTLQLLVT